MLCFRKFLSFFLIFVLTCSDVAAKRPLFTENFLDHGKLAAVKTLVSNATHAVIEGVPLEAAFKETPLDVAVDTVGGYAFQNIGDHHETWGELGHTVAHFMTGFATGLALSKGNLHGGLSGGLGAVLAEKTAEWLPATNTPETNAQRNADLGKLVAVTATALIPKLHPEIAHHTGTTAVDHNFLKHFQPKTIKEVEQSLEGSQKVWDVVNPKLPGAAQAREKLPENLLIDLVFPERLWDLAPGFALISKPIKAASAVTKVAPKVVTKALPKATFTTTVPKMVPKKVAPLPKPTTTAPAPKPKIASNLSQGPPKVVKPKITREKRWLELANEPNTRLPKEVAHHVREHKGKGLKDTFGLELAHKPKKPAVQGHDYSEAMPKTVADHRGIQHRFLKEKKDGTTISKPKTDGKNNKLTLPKAGKLPE